MNSERNGKSSVPITYAGYSSGSAGFPLPVESIELETQNPMPDTITATLEANRIERLPFITCKFGHSQGYNTTQTEKARFHTGPDRQDSRRRGGVQQ